MRPRRARGSGEPGQQRIATAERDGWRRLVDPERRPAFTAGDLVEQGVRERDLERRFFAEAAAQQLDLGRRGHALRIASCWYGRGVTRRAAIG
jgi:hypothetical protein